MALTGELTDLSLAELIEFFCNQRKTGRLKVLYQSGPGYFYLQSGSVVHARVGDLKGIEAVYYALTQRNAQFTFSPAFEAPEHSINQPWTSVVLEGLRRMDEGINPPSPISDDKPHSAEQIKVEAHEEKPKTNETAPDPVEHLVEAVQPSVETVQPSVESSQPRVEAPRPRVEPPRPRVETPAPSVPFLSQIEPASRFSSGPWKLGAVFAAIVLIIGVVAVPWGLYARSKAARLANESKPVVSDPAANSQPAPQESAVTQAAPAETDPNAVAPAPNSEAADQARRQREQRLREEARAREKAAESSAALPSQQSSPAAGNQAAAKPQTSPSTGSRKVTVQVTYDENGRVTQASGGDATALRIARQKRFPAGKAGSATITIPIN